SFSSLVRLPFLLPSGLGRSAEAATAGLSSVQQAGQVERYFRERDQQHDADQIRAEEPEDPLEDRFDRDRVADDAFDDEDVEPDGRRDQADLEQLGHQDAVPDQIDVQAFDRRQEDRQRQQHDADRIEEAAEEQQDRHRAGDEQERADLAFDDDFG